MKQGLEHIIHKLNLKKQEIELLESNQDTYDQVNWLEEVLAELTSAQTLYDSHITALEEKFWEQVADQVESPKELAMSTIEKQADEIKHLKEELRGHELFLKLLLALQDLAGRPSETKVTHQLKQLNDEAEDRIKRSQAEMKRLADTGEALIALHNQEAKKPHLESGDQPDGWRL